MWEVEVGLNVHEKKRPKRKRKVAVLSDEITKTKIFDTSDGSQRKNVLQLIEKLSVVLIIGQKFSKQRQPRMVRISLKNDE